MAVDPTLGAVIAGIVTPLITTGGLLGVAWIRRQPSKLEDEKQEAESNQTQFQQNMELNKYIDARIADATSELRRDVADLKRALGWMHRWVQRIRRAITEYMRDVETTWPTGATHAPPQSDHILELLDEENLDDTLTNDIVRRMAADSRSHQPADPPGSTSATPTEGH